MEINTWWGEDPAEIYWIEITDRTNLGADLNAPQVADDGNEFWGYSLLKEVADGDVVWHYDKNVEGLVGWSRASGGYWEDEVVWGARGTTARAAGVEPYARPGFRVGLEDFSLIEPVTLADFRGRESEIRQVREELGSIHRGTLYFPLSFYPGSLRPTQGYLAKFPRALVSLFPRLAQAAEEAQAADRAARRPIVQPPLGGNIGATYRPGDEEVAVADRDPMHVDPALVERGLRGHIRTQNRLAQLVSERGLTPRSHRPGEPNFDLAWESQGSIYVVEVKSTTRRNEEKQLRLGLGQVLRYGQILSRLYAPRQVIPVLAAENEPIDDEWLTLCRSLGVTLVRPGTMADLF